MSYEPSEIKLRAKVHRIIHRQRNLEANHKTISRKQEEELQPLMNQVSQNPFMTIQLRESTIEKLRDFSICLKGEGNDWTYDDLVNHVLCNFEK